MSEDTNALVTSTPAAPDPAPEPAPKAKPIPPRAVKTQVEGFQWREFLVRLPAGLGMGNLGDPTIWREVQASPGALQRLDRLMIVAHDEAWAVETIVAAATRRGVTLTKPQRIDLEPRTEVLAGDDLYQIHWDGVAGAYLIRRRTDNQRMAGPAATVQQAHRMLDALYPQRII